MYSKLPDESELAMSSTYSVTSADATLIFNSNEKGWFSVDLLAFNGNRVRNRTMNDVEASWHKHSDTDEMYFVLSGHLEIDVRDATGSITTHILGPNTMLVVHPNSEHRARSRGSTTLLVLDAIDK